MINRILIAATCLATTLFANPIPIDDLKQKANPFAVMPFAESMYKGDSYITKDEFTEIKKQVEAANKTVKDGPFDFLLYFSSSSVPSMSTFRVLHEIGILQDNDIRLDSKIYFMGPPDDFREYMFKVDNEINNLNLPADIQVKIDRNFNLKIDPRFFYKFDLKKVPAMALAKCPALVPDVNQCEISYLIKGDVSLTSFFYEISLKNKKFEKYVKILQGNKIVGGK